MPVSGPKALVQLRKIGCSAEEDERQLIQALYFDGISVREYARRSGVSDMAVRKRRDRILKKLNKFFEEEGSHL